MLDFHNCCCSLPIHLFASLCCFVHANLLQHCFQVFPSLILNCWAASRITFSSVKFDLSFCNCIFFCLITTYFLYKSTSKGKCLRTLWAQRQLVRWEVGRKPVLIGVDSKTRLDKGHLIQHLPRLSWSSLDSWTSVNKNPSSFSHLMVSLHIWMPGFPVLGRDAHARGPILYLFFNTYVLLCPPFCFFY